MLRQPRKVLSTDSDTMKTASNLVALFLTLFCLMTDSTFAQEKLVIAHRGASAYLPEHTLQSKILAFAMGADYIEQDVVMTRDDQLLVFHDLTLDRTTNVADIYPGRRRADGNFYVIDFTLEEIQRLRINHDHSRAREAGLPAQYPELFVEQYTVHTLAEEIELIQSLNAGSGRNVGLYPEIKSPWFHHQAGKDLSLAVLQTLKAYGYDSKSSPVFLQSFDFNEIQRIHDELLPSLQMDLSLVQLIAENSWLETYELNAAGSLQVYDYSWMHSAEGIQRLAGYVVGIGPNLDMIIRPESSQQIIISTNLVVMAHTAGLSVHPYTFRADARSIPGYARDFEELLELFLFQQNVDGVFTDYPDRTLQFLQSYARD